MTFIIKPKNKFPVQNIPNIAKDDIEYGYDNVIPLWLFGLMY